MKKIFYSICIFIFIFIFILIYFKFFSFHTQIHKVVDFELKLPFYSKIYHTSKSNDEYVLTFKTFLSKDVILNKINDILNEYEEYICQNQVFYYDKDNDITIKDVDIGNNEIINKYSVTISKGMFDNNFCSKVIDYKNIKYQIKDVLTNPHEYKYKNIVDGNIYNVYSNLKNKAILLNTGMNKMNYLRNMLRYGWVSMNQFIDYLDYIVLSNKCSKVVNKDYVIYKTKDFSLLKCNNNDIYINEMEYDYSNFICK